MIAMGRYLPYGSEFPTDKKLFISHLLHYSKAPA